MLAADVTDVLVATLDTTAGRAIELLTEVVTPVPVVPLDDEDEVVVELVTGPSLDGDAIEESLDVVLLLTEAAEVVVATPQYCVSPMWAHQVGCS